LSEEFAEPSLQAAYAGGASGGKMRGPVMGVRVFRPAIRVVRRGAEKV